MKILVTGGTGFTGHNLSKKLLSLGHEVRMLVRSRERVFLHDQERLEIIEGDIRSQKAVEQAVAGADRVFNIAAMYRSAASVDQDYWDIHVNGVKHLLEASLKYGVQRFVHCSTVGVHGDVQGTPAHEESAYAPADIYQRTKLEGELLAREFGDRHGLPLSVVRPTAIYGPGDLRLLKMFKMAVQKVIPVLGDGEICYHMVYIDDLVQGLLLAADKDEAIGEVFIIGGEERMILNDLLSTIAEITGSPGRRLHIPVTPFQWAGSICEKICIPLGLEPPIHRRRVDFFTKSRSFDISKAKSLLGYSPQYGLHDGLRRTANWYHRRGLLTWRNSAYSAYSFFVSSMAGVSMMDVPIPIL